MDVQIVNLSSSAEVAAALPVIVEACRRGAVLFCADHDLPVPAITYDPAARAPVAGRVALYVADRGANTSPFVEGFHRFGGGVPFAYAFAGFAPHVLHDPTRRAGSLAAIVAHELLEMLLDPRACRYVRAQLRGWDGALYNFVAEEVCDPVQESALELDIDGALVDFANWVTPAWFTPGAEGPYDALGLLEAPLSLLHGGYAIVATLGGADLDLFAVQLVDHPAPMSLWRAQMKNANEWSRTRLRSA